MITIEPPRTLGALPEAGLSKAGLARFLNRARAVAGVEGEVHVLLTDDATLKRLNRTFRGKNAATDVLSFPAAGSSDGNGAGVAGDVAISLETAARGAARFGHSLRDEVRVLLLHGTLHLAGFDHERDSGEMAAREGELRRELGLSTGLIGRVSGPANRGKNKQRRNAGVLRLRAARSAQDDDVKQRASAARSAQDDDVKQRASAARSAQDDDAKQRASAARSGQDDDVKQRARAARSAQDDDAKQRASAARSAQDDDVKQRARAARSAQDDDAKQRASAARSAQDDDVKQRARAARSAQDDDVKQRASAGRSAQDDDVKQRASVSRSAQDDARDKTRRGVVRGRVQR